MAHTQTRHRSQVDVRHRSQSPVPAVDEVEQRLMDVLSPSWLAPRQLERRAPRQPQRLIRMRQRLLTRPVMVASVVSRVWRRVPSVAERQKVVARAGLWGIAPLRGSAQAITKRRDVMPAAVMGELLSDVCTRLQAQTPVTLPHPSWAAVRARCAQVAIGDGSPLDALRPTTAVLRQREGLVLAGRVRVMVEAFSHRPLWQLDTEEAAAHDKRLAVEILAALPVGGLWSFDLGFFSVLGFDALTDQQKDCVPRLREQTAYRTVQVRSQGPYDRDEHLAVGPYRSNPGQHPWRMISVWGQGTWSRSLSNVLTPQELAARQVCELYRRRWRIEAAFALTKRLVDLASVWTGSTNAVQVPLSATFISMRGC